MKNTIARIVIITLIVWYFVSVIVGVLALNALLGSAVAVTAFITLLAVTVLILEVEIPTRDGYQKLLPWIRGFFKKGKVYLP